MARKDCSKCGDATCNCAIIEGPGTNVTGIGSGASPYIVEADIVHVDTPTVTLTGNGGSTPLSAVVNLCGLTDNLNEVSSGSLLVKGVDPDCLAVLDPGVAGQAVVSNGTGFVLGTPTQTPITPVDTPSVNLTVSGVDDHTLQADVVISPDAGNTLVENANGLFAAGGAITVADTNCIDLEGVGTVADPLTATPIIDPDPCNVLTCEATGLMVTLPGAISISSLEGPQVTVPQGNFAPNTQTGALQTITNNDPCRDMILQYHAIFNQSVSVGNGTAAQTSSTYELSVNGGAFFVIYLDRIGVNGVGMTAAVPNVNSLNQGTGRIFQQTLAPGATITFQIRATVQVLNAFVAGPIFTSGCAWDVRGFYV